MNRLQACNNTVVYVTGQYSSSGRVSASVAGRGFESQPRHTKGIKNSTSSSLADACIKRVVLGT